VRQPTFLETELGFTISNWTVRQFRGWYAATYYPSVDLQELCDSYHNEGEMGLPRELIDKIMRYHDLQTLKRCSLTSRAFYSASRPFVHRRMVLGIRSVVRGFYPEVDPFDRDNLLDEAEVFLARYLSAAGERGLLRHGYVQEVRLDLGLGNPEHVLQLPQLQALETVHTLSIERLDLPKFLPSFGRHFSQFVPTLRSLSLQATRCESAHQLMEFICRFPHLDDLELVNPCGPDRFELPDVPLGSKGPRLQQPLPFGGHLALKGSSPIVQCLLDLPGDLRFRSIEVAGSPKDLTKLLAACSSTLEVLKIDCSDNGKSTSLTGIRASPLKSHRPPVRFPPT